jgi:hypothetical protein
LADRLALIERGRKADEELKKSREELKKIREE